jgi:UDP-glucuronate decarboxylase
MSTDTNKVICIDNFQTGTEKNIMQWRSNPRFELVNHDVREPFNVEADQVWHLACPASPDKYQQDPIATAETCFMGTRNALSVAHRCKARILFTSTSEIYGDPLTSPQHEGYLGNVNCIGPRACYDEGKRIAETLMFDHARMHGTSIAVARIFNTYGPRMSAGDGRVVTNFISQALEGKPLTVYGDGLQTRSFCYCSDLVEGLVALMNSGEQGPINLGNPEEITIRRLARIVRDTLNAETGLLNKPKPEDDPQRRKPDVTTAKKLLGWQPVISLENGLKETVADIAEQIKQEYIFAKVS